MGAMGELEPLSQRTEGYGVLSDHVTRAQREDSDLLSRALARQAVPAVHGGLGEIAPEGLGDHLRHPQRRPARRVLLVAVMGFADLHVVVVAEQPGDVGQHAKRHVDGDAHVGREQDGRLLGETFDLVLLGAGEARRPDHRAPALAGEQSQMGEARLVNSAERFL